MSDNPKAAPANEQEAGDDEHLLVRARINILPILGVLAAKALPVRVQFSSQARAVATRLLSLKPHYEELVFDGAGIDGLAALDGTTSLTVDAVYDHLHVRFTAGHAEAMSFNARPAFRACIPLELLRMQRRGSARYPVPSLNPPVVSMHIGDRKKPGINLRVMDISTGGLCLVLESRSIGFGPGTTLPRCRLEIPGIGTIETDLVVSYVDTMEGGNGRRRMGCRFSSLGMLALERVRDYVTHLERSAFNAAGGQAGT